MLQAQLARFPASGHVLHFIDWAKIELTKDSLGRYHVGIFAIENLRTGIKCAGQEFTLERSRFGRDNRQTMLQAQLARFPASGHVLHFIDWAKIELTKDSLGHSPR
jgi:glycyl-tRNA synthetase (class II)